MSATYVYLVHANTMYEGGHVVACFSLERDAKAFAEKCRRHDAREPACPYLNAEDSEWDAFHKKQANWVKRHPAKLQGSRDSYDIEPIRVRPPVMSKPVD